jgi:hypothetical protein
MFATRVFRKYVDAAGNPAGVHLPQFGHLVDCACFAYSTHGEFRHANTGNGRAAL